MTTAMPSPEPLSRHSYTASEDNSPSGRGSTPSRHVQDTLRVLRSLEKVEISGTSLNWDAKKCFVLLVYMRDTEARKSAYARGTARNSPAPFQIERTPRELKKLLSAMRQWCLKPHPTDDKPCSFCTPVTNDALVGEALRLVAAQDATDEAHDPTDNDDHHTRHPTTCCFGFLSKSFGMGGDSLQPESDDEWEAWLNIVIAHIRVTASLEAEAGEMCDGTRHVPALLARFLLDGFLTDAIPIMD